MIFSELKYTPIDFELASIEMNQLVDQIVNATNAKEQITLIYQLDNYYKNISSKITLASIRHDIDTSDLYYMNEVNNNIVQVQQMVGILKKYSLQILKSPFIIELKNEFGAYYFSKIELKAKLYNESLKELYIEESLLSKEYNEFLSKTIIQIDEKSYNLSELNHLKVSKDRNLRKKVFEVEKLFLKENSNKLQTLFSELLYIRNKIAQSSGYDNYVSYSFDSLERTDYSIKEVKSFRENIVKYILPVLDKYREIQKQNLQIDNLYTYDLACLFQDGDAKINGDLNLILENFKYMLEELSPQSKEFINHMLDNKMLDLDARNNKRLGGYCTYISSELSPFVFCNFTGGSSDIRVLAHEAGHAFQMFESMRKQKITENYMPSLEACEIHSKSMELILLDWSILFFGNDAKKYKFSQMIRSLTTIVDACLIDEFQELIYTNNIASPQERDQVWYELKMKYKTNNLEDDAPTDLSPKWLLIPHIFNTPFYYIDYALAQTCALQFWKNFQLKPFESWQKMLPLYQNGGSKSFLNLIDDVGLTSPFIEGAIINAANIMDGELINYN